MTTQKMITCRVYSYSYDIEDTLDNLIIQLQADREKLTHEGWTNLSLVSQEEYIDYSNEAPRDRIYLQGTRLETIEEAQKREDQENVFRQQQHERDRIQFERLSKIFG